MDGRAQALRVALEDLAEAHLVEHRGETARLRLPALRAPIRGWQRRERVHLRTRTSMDADRSSCCDGCDEQ